MKNLRVAMFAAAHLIMDMTTVAFVFVLTGVREFGGEAAAFVLVNIATNVALNLIVYLVCVFADMAEGTVVSDGAGFSVALGFIVFLLEIFVVQAEYAVLKKFMQVKGLFWYVLGANALSAVVGTMLLVLFTNI